MTWEKASFIATTIGIPIVAVAGLVLTWRTYSETSQAQAQSTAASTYQEYLRISLDPANARYLAPDKSLLCDERYQVYAAYTLLVGESIYDLPGEGDSWRRTIEDLIRDQEIFVSSDLLPLDEYSLAYQDLIRSVVPRPASRATHCAKRKS